MGVITEIERQKYFAYLDGVADGLNETRNDVNSVLDKIRAEIDEARFIDKDTKLCKNANASGLEVAMQIIDKYKTESEPQESEDEE